MNNKLDYIDKRIQELKDDGVYRELPVNYGPCANIIDLDHRQVVNLSSNNYLGLANHPRVKAQAIAAIEKYGAGAERSGPSSAIKTSSKNSKPCWRSSRKKKPSSVSNPV